VAADRVISVVDPDARHLHNSRSSYRDGDKAQLAAEPETGLVTAAALTPANTADGPTGVGLLATEAPGLQVLGDSAYGGGETRAALTAAGHAQLIKPIPLRPAVPGGFTKDDFAIDLHAGTVTCPAGQTVAITPGGRAVFDWRCGPCPLRERCTRAKDGKTVNLHRHEAELAAARRQVTDPAFQASYRRWRPWWNARSPGWSPAATVGCATAAWPATSTACRCGSPRSTCADWSPWGWTTVMLGGRWPEQGSAGPGCQ
jgi:hypothetical protein